MYCDRGSLRVSRCGLFAGHDGDHIEADDIVCPDCGVRGVALVHPCPATQLMWRRTEWFRLAFGGWGRCRPPLQKEVLTWTGEGRWMDEWRQEWSDDRILERLPRWKWEEDPTDPG